MVAAATDLVTVAEVKKSLRIADATTTWDDDLADYVTAATPVIEDVTGPMVTGSRSLTFDGGVAAVLLPATVQSVTSVTENGDEITDWTPNLASGIVYGGQRLAPRWFFPGRQNIVVTYTAGAYATTAAVPKNVKLAARELVRHWWQQGQQGQRPSMGDQPTAETPSGFAVPHRVLQLLKSTPAMPGFA